MNGECGNAQNGSIDFDKLMHIRIMATSENDSASNTQIPIKPSVPQASSISLDIHHGVVTLAGRRFGLQFEAGAVGVRRYHVKTVPDIVPRQKQRRQTKQHKTVTEQSILQRREGGIRIPR